MKTKFAFALALFTFVAINISLAQNDSTRKGHFTFGATLFSYSSGGITESYQTSSPYTVPPYTTKYSVMSVTFNLSAAYFVSNRVSVGLNFGNSSGNFVESYYNPNYYVFGPSSLLPSSLFFRYYLSKDDNNIASFFLEGAIGGSYNSIMLNGAGTAQTIANLNGDFNIVVSIHTIKHLDVQVRAGIVYNDYYFNDASQPGQYPQNISSPAFTSSLGLQYKL